MDGLDDQAQLTLQSIIEQLYTSETVQVKHSSRDLILLGLTQELQKESFPAPIMARKLVLRSGISLTAIGWLEEALMVHPRMDELEVNSLQDVTVLAKIFELCHKCQIRKLTLNSFLSYARGRHNAVSETIRKGLLFVNNTLQEENEVVNHLQGAAITDGQYAFYDVLNGTYHEGISPSLRPSTSSTAALSDNFMSSLEYLEINNYPIGVKGCQIFAAAPLCTTGLTTLKLLDCDIQSDSAVYLAHIIRYSPKLQILDLSYNRHFRSNLTREMTVKTIVKSGLKDNLTLLELKMGGGVDKDINRSQLDQHLDINRLLLAYQKQKDVRSLYGIHPGLWSDLLGRVSVKPAALYFFLQQNITTVFA